jgi:tetratricopeptide (TPR) repeat protein
MNFEKYRHYYRARLFEALRKPEQALEAYVTALRHDRNFFRAAAAIAVIHVRARQYDQAELYFREALRIKPGNADIIFNLGFVHDQQGRREEAIARFAEAVRIKPILDRAWYGMGMAQATLGRHDEAAKALEEASRLQPMNSHAWYALGMAYHCLNNPERVKEIALYLHRISPLTCRQLIQETERGDLHYLVKDLAA